MFEDNLKERYGLAIDRIAEIKENSEIEDAGLAAYFTYTAEFLLLVDKWNEKRKAGGYDKLPLEELQHWNTVLYEDIIGKQYDNSFANPSYACAWLGEDIGRILSFLYTELRGCIAFAAEQRKADFTVLLELFVECYCICKGGENIAAQLKDSIYWYMSDYSDDFIEYRVREQLDPSLDFAVRIIMDSDLTDLRYLYRYGEYITENELRTAAFLNTLSQTEIEQMASTFTEGYRIGFELGNKDISIEGSQIGRVCEVIYWPVAANSSQASTLAMFGLVELLCMQKEITQESIQRYLTQGDPRAAKQLQEHFLAVLDGYRYQLRKKRQHHSERMARPILVRIIAMVRSIRLADRGLFPERNL